MPELMIDHITSLDGFGSAQGWPGLWGLGGPEYVGWLEHDGATPRTLLLGATTYRLFAQLAADEPEAMAALTDRPKIVFSRTLGTPLSWANTTLVDQDAVAAVAALKGVPGNPLRTLGSPGLARSLLRAGLVDRLRVVVFPVVTGATGGDRLYDGWPDVSLQLVDHRTLDDRLTLLEYVPTILEGPPEHA